MHCGLCLTSFKTLPYFPSLSTQVLSLTSETSSSTLKDVALVTSHCVTNDPKTMIIIYYLLFPVSWEFRQGTAGRPSICSPRKTLSLEGWICRRAKGSPSKMAQSPDLSIRLLSIGLRGSSQHGSQLPLRAGKPTWQEWQCLLWAGLGVHIPCFYFVLIFGSESLVQSTAKGRSEFKGRTVTESVGIFKHHLRCCEQIPHRETLGVVQWCQNFLKCWFSFWK